MVGELVLVNVSDEVRQEVLAYIEPTEETLWIEECRLPFCKTEQFRFTSCWLLFLNILPFVGSLGIEESYLQCFFYMYSAPWTWLMLAFVAFSLFLNWKTRVIVALTNRRLLKICKLPLISKTVVCKVELDTISTVKRSFFRRAIVMDIGNYFFPKKFEVRNMRNLDALMQELKRYSKSG